MTTGGGGLDPPQEGTRPPDEERARPTVEEKDDHAADERAGSGGSPGGSPDAPRDGGSGQELPDVSRGKAPSTTILRWCSSYLGSAVAYLRPPPRQAALAAPN